MADSSFSAASHSGKFSMHFSWMLLTTFSLRQLISCPAPRRQKSGDLKGDVLREGGYIQGRTRPSAEDERKGSWRVDFTCHTSVFTTKEGGIPVTITVLISVMGHVVVAGIYNYPLPLLILYFLCLQQAAQLIVVLHLVAKPKLSFLKGLSGPLEVLPDF